jgi:hypothetical protein
MRSHVVAAAAETAAAAVATRVIGGKGCVLLCAMKQSNVSAACAAGAVGLVPMRRDRGPLADVAATDSGVTPSRFLAAGQESHAAK